MWSQRVFSNRFELSGGIDLSRERALGAIRNSIEAQSTTPDLTRSLGRGWTLFRDYFPRFYSNFEELFETSTGLSVEQYYVSLSSIITNFMKPSLDTNIFRIGELKESPYGATLERYIAFESLDAENLIKCLWEEAERKDLEEVVPNYNYRPIREKPIFRTDDGRAIILDPSFFSERAMVGPLFYLLKNYSSKANELFSAFGYAFEDYLKTYYLEYFLKVNYLLDV